MLWFLLALPFTVVGARNICNNYGYSYTYCDGGKYCCGYNKCCNPLSIGAIAGIVIAGIIGFCILVAIICACKKKAGSAGRVVQPMQGTAVTVVSANHHQTMGLLYVVQQPPQYGQQYGAQFGAQPAYGAQYGQPPQFGMQPSSAYPPPAYPPPEK